MVTQTDTDEYSGIEAMQSPTFKLVDLLAELADGPVPDCTVQDITLDSRQVRAGALFLACAGSQVHGLTFARSAAAAGAVAVAYEPEPGLNMPQLDIPLVAVPHLASLSGRLAHRFFAEPSLSLAVTGVTGTNGKTTTAHLIANALTETNSQCGFVGTIGAGMAGALEPAQLTTPDAVSVHRLLMEFANSGASSVAMEVSSHALHQGRVSGVRFRNAVFTNLTRDHLDYHGSYEAYARAKASLFAAHHPQNMVINVDDEFGSALASRMAAHGRLVVTGASAAEAQLQDAQRLIIETVTPQTAGLMININGSWGPARIESPLLGRFNASNLVNALAVLLLQDVPLAAACDALSKVSPPAGRMELYRPPQPAPGPQVIVDYAHTPDALAKALQALREHCRGRLWCVFGCGGDRDPGKRPQMAAAADALADYLVITDDNPRTEDPAQIVQGMLGAIKQHPVEVIHDRREAIAYALGNAEPTDVVLIAGKGHEPYQIRGTKRLEFSDAQVVREILET